MLRTVFFSLFSLAIAAQISLANQQRQSEDVAGQSKEDKVIGRIGKRVYRESDFLDFLPALLQPAQLEQVKKNAAMQKQYQRSFLEAMLIVNKAEKDGVDKSPEFNVKLARLTKTLMMQETISKFPELQKTPAPTEEQLKAYYEENKNKFKAKDTATARHILVAVRKNETETDKLTDEEAKARIAKAKAELIGDKSWEEIAREYSDDTGSKENGGRYENFNPTQMVPEFAEAVRTQEIGVIGNPIRTQFGYHIILVEKRKIGQIQTFDEAKGTAQKELTDKMRNDTWKSFIDSLKTELEYKDTASDSEPEAAQIPKAVPNKPAVTKPSGGKK